MSLLEVAIATALLTVVALGVAPLLAVAVRSNLMSRLQLDATAAATERMEQLIATPFDGPVSPSDSLTVDYSDFSDIVASPAGSLRRRWSITPASFDPDNTRIFSVRVSASGMPVLAAWTTIRTRIAP